jgi:MFS family permease
MSFAPYRRVLAVPGVRALLLIGVLARIPATAIAITLTLHVATTLGRSWAQAGLVTAAFTIGGAVGAPLLGRLIDRRGLRTVMVLTTTVAAAVWFTAPHLPYVLLLPAALVAGLFAVPIFPAIRLALAAMVPPDQRRPAFALDSMIVELSFMIGPALAVILATSLPPGYGLDALAGGMIATGVAMYALNPPTRAEGQHVPEVAAPRRTWFSRRLAMLLVTAMAAMLILSATDLTIVATLREAGAVRWTGLAIALWCAYSLIGGLIFGTIRRPVSFLFLVGAMALLTIPVGLAPSWQWLLLALIPAGMACAPCMVAANDTLARIVPANSRGEATGLLSSALTAGTTAGAPFAGLVIDGAGPAWAFAAAGTVAAVVVLVAWAATRKATTQLAVAPAVEPANA